jgi:zinc transporter ZupT
MLFLLASLAVLGVGPLTFALFERRHWAIRVLDAVVVVAVGGLVIIHIIPETFERAGWIAAAPLVIGLLGPSLVERGLANLERQAHLLLAILVLLGLGLHAIMDGVVLAVPSVEEGVGRLSLPLAIVLHRIPVSLLIWWLMRPAVGVLGASLALSIEGVGAIVGYAGAQYFVAHVNSPAVAVVQAFVAGSMLHVMVDRRDYGAAHSH